MKILPQLKMTKSGYLRGLFLRRQIFMPDTEFRLIFH